MLATIAGVRYLATRSAVADLVDIIVGGRLMFPAVVVTRPSHAQAPAMPLDELHDAVNEFADVYYVEDSNVIRDVIRDRHPGVPLDAVNVFGGATRVFPTGPLGTSHIYTARTREEGRRGVRAIVRKLGGGTDTSTGPISYSTSTPDPEAPKEGLAFREVTLEAENAALRGQVAALTAKMNQATARPLPAPRAKAATPAAPVSRPGRRLFADGGEEIRYRVLTLWAEQTSPQEKLDSPLPDYVMGDAFAASVDEHSCQQTAMLDKIARAVLRVITGADRDGHKLDLSGAVRPEDGAAPWRTYVEQKAPSARRLHYWRVPGGGIELSRIVLHDDYTP